MFAWMPEQENVFCNGYGRSSESKQGVCYDVRNIVREKELVYYLRQEGRAVRFHARSESFCLREDEDKRGRLGRMVTVKRDGMNFKHTHFVLL